MARRALLVGSQTGGLTGVHADVELMAELLDDLGFATRRAIAGDATLDGIRAAYRELIEETAEGDAAVVYYSGHGGNLPIPPDARGPDDPPRVQFLVPTDAHAHPAGEFGGLLADELSLLQWQLAARSKNVTTILDCCHSARMSRAATMIPKADPLAMRFPWESVKAGWQQVRDDARGAGVALEGNPDAVRVVACAPEQSAYELLVAELGRAHGALTARLVTLLRTGGHEKLTWRQLMHVVRPGVMDLVPQQRPEIEGPADRYVFSLEDRPGTGVVPVHVQDGELHLEAPALFGVGVGDTFALVGPGGDPRAPLATAVVDAVAPARAHLLLTEGTADAVPDGAEAHPLEVALGRRPVIVRPLDHPDRPAVVEALRASPHLRIPDDGETAAMAGVELRDDGALLLDAVGEPLQAAPRPVGGSGGLALLAADLQQLARAAHLRDLDSGTGEEALPGDVTFEYVLVGPDGEVPLPAANAHLFDGDAVLVRVRNASGARRYVSIFDVGLRGRVSLLTAAEPSGVGIPDGQTWEARLPGGAPAPIRLFWPSELPRGGPRPELFVSVVSDRPHDLRALTQPGTATRGPGGSGLQTLLADVVRGTRDAAPTAAPAEAVPYRVERFDFLLHPTARPPAEGTEFELDERPDPSLRLVVPRAAGDLPKQVAVRLTDVVVHSNRALLSSTVRVDALVITRAGAGVAPYQAATARFDRVRDGDRLPLDNLLVYEGPVDGFLDIAMWVARDDKQGVELAELLQREASSVDMKTALTALAGLAIAAPQAAIAAGAVAAVATLVRTGARLLDKATGKSIGIYRTSLLPHERLGAGTPSRRHPGDGLLRAQDMSFAYEVVATG